MVAARSVVLVLAIVLAGAAAQPEGGCTAERCLAYCVKVSKSRILLRFRCRDTIRCVCYYKALPYNDKQEAATKGRLKDYYGSNSTSEHAEKHPIAYPLLSMHVPVPAHDRRYDPKSTFPASVQHGFMKQQNAEPRAAKPIWSGAEPAPTGSESPTTPAVSDLSAAEPAAIVPLLTTSPSKSGSKPTEPVLTGSEQTKADLSDSDFLKLARAGVGPTKQTVTDTTPTEPLWSGSKMAEGEARNTTSPLDETDREPKLTTARNYLATKGPALTSSAVTNNSAIAGFRAGPGETLPTQPAKPMSSDTDALTTTETGSTTPLHGKFDHQLKLKPEKTQERLTNATTVASSASRNDFDTTALPSTEPVTTTGATGGLIATKLPVTLTVGQQGLAAAARAASELSEATQNGKNKSEPGSTSEIGSTTQLADDSTTPEAIWNTLKPHKAMRGTITPGKPLFTVLAKQEPKERAVVDETRESVRTTNRRKLAGITSSQHDTQQLTTAGSASTTLTPTKFNTTERTSLRPDPKERSALVEFKPAKEETETATPNPPTTISLGLNPATGRILLDYKQKSIKRSSLHMSPDTTTAEPQINVTKQAEQPATSLPKNSSVANARDKNDSFGGVTLQFHEELSGNETAIAEDKKLNKTN